MADDPLPADAVRKLDLFEEATFDHAMSLLLWAWEQSIEQTVEEQAEEEVGFLFMSDAAEAFNEMTGAEIPVLYPKGTRTKHR